MTCEHHFVAVPGSLRVIFCERCGEGRDLQTAHRVAKPAPRTKPTRGRRANPQPELPFGVPLPIGNGRSFMDPGTPVTADDLGQLEHAFAGAGPVSQARDMNELADQLGLRREAPGDPPGTYRPGTGENPEWIKP